MWIPTLLGMITLVLGAFLVVPATANTANTALPAAASVAFLVQVRMEDEHLTRMHGTAFQAYRASVPRWIDLLRQRPAVAIGEPTPPSEAHAEPPSASRFT
jgi:protein-S-isoprenylcysteine O-methyltransferase Ste14